MNSTVLVAGTFDFFHPGHQKFLTDAAELGTNLFVIVARDSNVFRIKKFFPTQDETIRKKNIEEWASKKLNIPVSVLLGSNENFLEVPQKINPNTIALGYDQKTPPHFFEIFSHTQITRLSPHAPEKFKSSFFRKKTKTLQSV